MRRLDYLNFWIASATVTPCVEQTLEVPEGDFGDSNPNAEYTPGTSSEDNVPTVEDISYDNSDRKIEFPLKSEVNIPAVIGTFLIWRYSD